MTSILAKRRQGRIEKEVLWELWRAFESTFHGCEQVDEMKAFPKELDASSCPHKYHQLNFYPLEKDQTNFLWDEMMTITLDPITLS